MQTVLVIIICVALVAIELLGVAVLVAPRTMWRILMSSAHALAKHVRTVAVRQRDLIDEFLRFRGPGFRPPRLV